jgi:hypothetical protein
VQLVAGVGQVLGPLGVADEAAHVHAALVERLHEPAADEPGGACHECLHQ